MLYDRRFGAMVIASKWNPNFEGEQLAGPIPVGYISFAVIEMENSKSRPALSSLCLPAPYR